MYKAWLSSGYGSITIRGWISVLSSFPKFLLSWVHTKQLSIIPEVYPSQIKQSKEDVEQVEGNEVCAEEQLLQQERLGQHESPPLTLLRSTSVSCPPPATFTSEEAKQYFCQEFKDVLIRKEE